MIELLFVVVVVVVGIMGFKVLGIMLLKILCGYMLGFVVVNFGVYFVLFILVMVFMVFKVQYIDFVNIEGSFGLVMGVGVIFVFVVNLFVG